MTADIPSPQLEGISYSDRLPIDWELVAAMPSEGELHRLQRSNEGILQTLLILDEPFLDEEEGEVPTHLRRLEAKVDLLVSLMGEMLATAVAMPSPHPVQISAQALAVESTGAKRVEAGNLLKIRLFLDSNIPRPLQLYGQVRAVQGESFILDYAPVEMALQDLLDKFVFRQHRRAIALSRHTQKSD
jgi:hypothetical protein